MPSMNLPLDIPTPVPGAVIATSGAVCLPAPMRPAPPRQVEDARALVDLPVRPSPNGADEGLV